MKHKNEKIKELKQKKSKIKNGKLKLKIKS